MTEPLASALSLSRHVLAEIKHHAATGEVTDFARVSNWQSRFEPAAESVTAAVKLGELVGRQHAGRIEGFRRRSSMYQLFLQAADRVDEERLHGILLQPRAGIVFDATAGDLDTELVGEPGLLKAAIANLLRNAIKYSVSTNAPGHIETAIHHVSGTGDERFAELRVTNTGFGIPSQYQGSIFTAFTRYVDEGNEVARRGMGLGLYLAAQIARAHQGSVRLVGQDRVGVNENGTVCYRTTFAFRVRADLRPGNYVEDL